MNDDEHVECLNERMFSSAVYVKDYASLVRFIFKHFGFMYLHVHGASCLDVNDTVASSSPVGGSGTL